MYLTLLKGTAAWTLVKKPRLFPVSEPHTISLNIPG